ncbi:MAG: hypothetical protein M0P10_05830 [Sphaerochaetaceae bacterium]|jgi:hypothetical protein|nr:hypothetical protein [Sphaerochaetaceae bacterium]
MAKKKKFSEIKKVRELKAFFQGLEVANRHKATDQLEYEAREMEHTFTLLLFGDAVGLPSPPIAVTMELLPLMKDDYERMVLRATQTGNGLSEIASIIGEP